jgi:hypothetical protein
MAAGAHGLESLFRFGIRREFILTERSDATYGADHGGNEALHQMHLSREFV